MTRAARARFARWLGAALATAALIAWASHLGATRARALGVGAVEVLIVVAALGFTLRRGR